MANNKIEWMSLIKDIFPWVFLSVLITLTFFRVIFLQRDGPLPLLAIYGLLVEFSEKSIEDDAESFLKGKMDLTLQINKEIENSFLFSKKFIYTLKGRKYSNSQQASIYQYSFGYSKNYNEEDSWKIKDSWLIKFDLKEDGIGSECTIRIYTGAKIKPLKCSIGKGSACDVRVSCINWGSGDFFDRDRDSSNDKSFAAYATGGYLDFSDYSHGEKRSPVRGKIDVYKPGVFRLTGKFDFKINETVGYPHFFSYEKDQQERKERKEKFIKLYKRLVTALEKAKKPSALLPFGYPKPMEELYEFEKKRGASLYLRKKSGRAFTEIAFAHSSDVDIGHDYERVARLVDKHLDFKTLLYALQMGAKHAGELSGNFPISNFVNDTIYFSNREYDAELYTKNKEGAEYWIDFRYDREAERWILDSVSWLGTSLDSLDVKWLGL